MQGGGFDEMGDRAEARLPYAQVRTWLQATGHDHLQLKRREAEIIFRRTGITFAVYTEGGDPERLIPFDIIPRILEAQEWAFLARGLEQRVKALNAFLRDAYGPREMVRAGRIPEEMVVCNPGFVGAMQGLEVSAGTYTHVAGIDVVRTGQESF